MTFRVGMKVVCVDVMGLRSTHPPVLFGVVYTVRGVFDDPIDGLGILLEEIINPMHERGEYGYRPHRFRPIVERKTDISCFKHMLHPQGVDA